MIALMTKSPSMPFGIGTTFDYSIPFEHMIPMLARAGFSYITLGGGNIAHSGYDTEEGRAAILRTVQAAGIAIDSVHAPFGQDCDISVPDVRIEIPSQAQPDVRQDTGAVIAPGAVNGAERTQETSPVVPASPATRRLSAAPERLEAVASVRKAIDACAALGARTVVIHPTDRFPVEQTRSRIQALRDSLRELLAFANRQGVRLALENMPSLVEMQVFDSVLEEFPDLGVCYDTSHAQLSGNTFGILQRYQDRIITTHISDNLGREDDHMLPYEGVIEWDEFAYYFGRVKQLQCFMLEVEVRRSRFKDTREFLDQALRRAQRLRGYHKEH